ncbi:MAG: ATP-binding protein [Deltaproteobacteria bacterium]|nr:ATP-binding protein [Deltaproteobacteria bacterium]
MFRRTLQVLTEKASTLYPVVALIGPRQSGKSTLVQASFPSFSYVSLENPDLRRMAIEDSRGFLSRYPAPVIFDEIQRAPELISYLQEIVDTPGFKGPYIVTGSQHLLLMEKMSQSLAGRVRILELLPLSSEELGQAISETWEEAVFLGGYPRVHQNKSQASAWLQDYFRTYVERDVRLLTRIQDIDVFERFVLLCAGRVGQLVNYESLAADCGTSPPTLRAWLAILKTSFICTTLSPHFQNFNKRIIKTPKLYFFDTGLLCYLLRIEKPEQISQHPLRGAIFENWIIQERMKHFYNLGKPPPLYFWRDKKGHEIDLIEDRGVYLYPSEIKSSSTFHGDFVNSLEWFNKQQDLSQTVALSSKGTCFFSGLENFRFKDYQIVSWKQVNSTS